MSELIEVPKWFDDIYKEVTRVITNEFLYVTQPEDVTNELLIKAISNQGYGVYWTDDLIRGILLPSTALVNMIQNEEDEKIEYVGYNKINLIKAIIDGYKVKEDKYIVVSINDYEDNNSYYGTHTTMLPVTLTSWVKHFYYEDEKHLEEYKKLDSKVYISGFDFELGGKAKQSFIKSLTELEPKLIMTKEKAEGLINSYRMMIPIN